MDLLDFLKSFNIDGLPRHTLYDILKYKNVPITINPGLLVFKLGEKTHYIRCVKNYYDPLIKPTTPPSKCDKIIRSFCVDYDCNCIKCHMQVFEKLLNKQCKMKG